MSEAEREQQLLEKRLEDLAEKTYRQNVYAFTGFLSMADMSVFYEVKSRFNHVGYSVFGEEFGCERQIIRFGTEQFLGYTEPFPIALLMLSPLIQKFADKLGHRDFLGAIMNLGIERSTIGDIFIKDNVGYVFCLNSIAEYLIQNLDKIKHTNIKIQRISMEEAEKFTKPELVTSSVTAASERIDGIVSKLYNLSRTQSIELFREGRVFVNGRLCENNSCFLKKDDVITVRGFGKFIYQGVQRETKKGKLSIEVLRYGQQS